MRLVSRLVLSCALSGLWLSCDRSASESPPPALPATPSPKPPKPEPEPEPEPAASPYVITRDATGMRIQRRDAPCPWLEYAPDSGSLRYRSDRLGCTNRSLGQEAAVTRELLDALAKEVGSGFTVKSFGLGEYPELYQRIALAAGKSPLWDRKRGKPTKDSLHATIAQLAPDASYYPEVVELFRALGLTPRWGGIEKVFVGPVTETPFADALLAAGLKPTDRVPYGSEVWFRLEPG